MDEVLLDIEDESTCWEACTIKPNCGYYVHYANEKTCNLYLQSEGAEYYKCDILRGPADKNYETVST